MLLDDIIGLLRETVRNAHVVDDERIDDRIFQDYIMLTRNQFVKNHLNEKGFVEQNTMQTEVLTITPYNSSNDLVNIDIGNHILRSNELPTMIEGRGGPRIFEISSPDFMSRTIQYVPFDRLRWVGNGVVNKNFIYGGFYNNRIYIKSGSQLEAPTARLLVKAIFADPTEVSTYVRNISQYPVNDYMIKYMLNELQKTDINTILSTKADTTNDASGEIQA